eukprot:GFUD01001945.1.p1 GENE.GFUD01001945.1~~GFUD01001945.1.p1  ORF type:complete len:437 (-),score=153.35 GFUD01001945.1:110-1420(-)
MTAMDPGPDLNTKYQKLATEYAKIRAQMTVLKKGLVDEQDKSSILGDQVHERDTQMRKQTSEMDAVLFRNQQLAKRINLLQEEAEAAASKKGKSRWKRDRSGSKERHSENRLAVDSAEQVINEELVAKITENAELKVKLNDIETQHTANTQALKLRIEDLEREKVELSSGVKVRETEASNFANDLKFETSQLNKKIEYLEKDVVEKNDKIVTLQVQLESIMDKCDALEKNATPVKTSDVSTQYMFVDEALEEVKESEKRERDSLAHRLEINLSKIKDLEKDREHWKLEYQLMQIKMEKVKQESGPTSDVTNLELDEVMALREEELKSVWETKIGDLIASRLMADSKAVAYYLELEALTARLYNKKREGEKLSREASTARQEEDKVRVEIAVTQENYESQLSVMSDHLASMNSKLAQQEDLIAQLKFEQKGGKKGKK